MPIAITPRLRETAFWVSRQERRQMRRFEALSLRLQEMADSAVDGNSFKATRLIEIASARRLFPKNEVRPRVLGFGADNWERYGLWPALSKASRFTLWQHGQEVAETAPGDSYRSEIANRFLRFVDEQDEVSEVNVVFFYASGAHISSELLEELRNRGIWTLLMGLDDKHQLSQPPDGAAKLPHQLRVAMECDLYWTTWRLAAEAINASGGSAWFAPPGGDPQFFHSVPRYKDIDLLFVGSRYGHRSGLVNYLRSRKLTVKAFGNGWEQPAPDFSAALQLFARSKIVLGNGSVGYMRDVRHLKGRDFEIPMAGEVYLTTFNPELCGFYSIGEEILCYDSFAECAETAREILALTASAACIRKRARERCVRDHTWDSRVAELFAQLPLAF